MVTPAPPEIRLTPAPEKLHAVDDAACYVPAAS
jgi:hypothetical protein